MRKLSKVEGWKNTLSRTLSFTLKRNLIGCKNLLEQYENRRAKGRCPLCVVNRGCLHCAWRIFMDDRCKNIASIYFSNDAGELRATMNKDWRTYRLRSLKIWVGEMEAELERRRREDRQCTTQSV